MVFRLTNKARNRAGAWQNDDTLTRSERLAWLAVARVGA